MRLPPNKRAIPSSTRRDELRRARAAAPILRLACPEASVVRVNLEFQKNPLLAHAPQTLSLYPPAKAFFAYECPFGDCDGVYDLNELVWETLKTGRYTMDGRVTCNGHRAGNGVDGSVCQLALSYLIKVRA
jgi:hypothetical protein